MTAEELRQRFTWMAKLEDDADVIAIPLSEPGTMLTDGDSLRRRDEPEARAASSSMEGEFVPAGRRVHRGERHRRGAVGAHRRCDPLIPYGVWKQAFSNAPLTAAVYVCPEGHRTLALASVPEQCRHRASRIKDYCDKPVQALAEAPADVQQKMLNPLKASKKASKK